MGLFGFQATRDANGETGLNGGALTTHRSQVLASAVLEKVGDSFLGICKFHDQLVLKAIVSTQVT